MDLPDYLKTSRAPRMAESLSANLGVSAPPYVSIMGNAFKLVDAVGVEQRVTTSDTKLGMYLDCVIIDKNDHISKIWWGRPFSPGEETWAPPDCWSDNGTAPSTNAALPQSPTCAACPNNVWGSEVSKITGRGVKACKDFQKLALLVPGYSVIFLLRVPPNSLRNLRDYVHKFNNQNFDFKDVVTRISFEQGVLGTLQFNAVAIIDQNIAGQREKAYEEGVTNMLVGKTDQPRTAALPGPSQPMTGTGQTPVEALPFRQPAPTVQPTNQPLERDLQPKQRRRRRTAAEMEQAKKDGQRTVQEASGGFTPAPFGIAPGAEPNQELKQGLDEVFGKK